MMYVCDKDETKTKRWSTLIEIDCIATYKVDYYLSIHMHGYIKFNKTAQISTP